jgi:hypothetical protein
MPKELEWTKGLTSEEVDRIFKHHPPRPGQVGKYERLRGEAQMLGRTIWLLCPESREKSLAITHLQQVVMWANASIALHDREETNEANPREA